LLMVIILFCVFFRQIAFAFFFLPHPSDCSFAPPTLRPAVIGPQNVWVCSEPLVLLYVKGPPLFPSRPGSRLFSDQVASPLLNRKLNFVVKILFLCLLGHKVSVFSPNHSYIFALPFFSFVPRFSVLPKGSGPAGGFHRPLSLFFLPNR